MAENANNNDATKPEPKVVYMIRERKEDENGKKRKGIWTEIGIAFVNSDGSLNVLLNAFPVNGKLHIRDRRKKEEDAE